MMTFSEDIEPIMLGKCIGCHVRGAGALAPRSLEGIDRVNSFKSAIQHALENCSMAPEGLMQLSKGEYSEFMAWLNGVPYTSSGGLVRVSFIEAQAWDTTPQSERCLPQLPTRGRAVRAGDGLVGGGRCELRFCARCGRRFMRCLRHYRWHHQRRRNVCFAGRNTVRL